MLKYLLNICLLASAPVAPPPLEPLTLVLNMANKKELPKNFRTMESPFKGFHFTWPSRKGLDQLNASGSAQFSELGLDAILQALPPGKTISIVDLRQESHGFVNGMAVSWRDTRDWSNIGKTLAEIDRNEDERLQNLLKQGVALIATKHVLLPVLVEKVATEQQIVQSRHLRYTRIPVTDHRKPTNEDVDAFIQFVRDLPPNSWVHFHCAAGRGRTTAFLILYDMLKNSKQASFDDIVRRQHFLGGVNYLYFPQSSWKYPYNMQKQNFLRQFYQYSREADPSTTLWSEWHHSKQLQHTP